MGMHLNDSQGQTVVHQELRLSNRVRPGRPFNLTLSNLSNHQLLLTWKTPYEIPECLEHLIRYKSNKDTEFMEHSIVNSLKFQIPSVDPEKRYTFYVKSKRNNNCATTDLWSEESEPAFWGKAVGLSFEVPKQEFKQFFATPPPPRALEAAFRQLGLNCQSTTTERLTRSGSVLAHQLGGFLASQFKAKVVGQSKVCQTSGDVGERLIFTLAEELQEKIICLLCRESVAMEHLPGYRWRDGGSRAASLRPSPGFLLCRRYVPPFAGFNKDHCDSVGLLPHSDTAAPGLAADGESVGGPDAQNPEPQQEV
ncbi:cytokine receptor common subunit gamma isoform X3 [Pantherophis guttatus]|nr:cytokine receptor common subunit gamma isoform X3 [Pantherophis guttatus]